MDELYNGLCINHFLLISLYEFRCRSSIIRPFVVQSRRFLEPFVSIVSQVEARG